MIPPSPAHPPLETENRMFIGQRSRVCCNAISAVERIFETAENVVPDSSSDFLQYPESSQAHSKVRIM